MILYWLLTFSVISLFITSVIMLRNRRQLPLLDPVSGQRSSFKKVSVCIPARNEERNIATLLESLMHQTYTNYDIHLLDDDSEDRTGEIAELFRERQPELLNIHKGLPKPAEWLGKSWACQQLGELSDGEIILFLDADTRLEKETLARIVHSMETTGAEMITVWPYQILKTFWEQTVLPFVYYALVSLLPVDYTYKDPGWLPARLRKPMRPAFAVANGQCIGFLRTAYEEIGEHTRVKMSVLEDVQLAREARKSGLTLRMFNGTDAISCRMYRNESELFNGLRKNFLAAFQNSVPLLVGIGFLLLVIHLLPFLVLAAALLRGNASLFTASVSPVLLLLLHRIWLARWFGWDPLYAFTHPLGALWISRLGVVKIRDAFTGYRPVWKNRKV